MNTHHSRTHFPALDGLRGLAVIAVMVLHFCALGHWQPLAYIDRLAAGAAAAGWAGVDLFFVLSGFLITGILYDTRTRERYFVNFYARRALRIFPLYYAVLVGYFVLLPAAAPAHDAVRRLTQGEAWYWTYTANIQIAMRGWGATSSFVDHFWSLAVEEQFYLMWPFLVLALARTAMLRVCATMVIGALALRVGLFAGGLEMGAYVLTPARMDSLAMGAAVALMMRDPAGVVWLKRHAPRALSLAAGAIAAIWWIHGELHVTDWLTGTIGFTALSVAFASLLVLVITASPQAALHRLLATPPLRAMGRYSYALYVVHAPVALLLPVTGLTAGVLPPIGGSTLPGQIVFSLAAGAVSIGAAVLSWHLFEKHFLKLKVRFGDTADRSPASVLAQKAQRSQRALNNPSVTSVPSSVPSVVNKGTAPDLTR